MGIYNFFNNEINCFYDVKPTINDKELYFLRYNFDLSTNSYNGLLPTKTFHYKYPESFAILNEECSKLYIIKDRMLSKSIEIKDITNKISWKNIYNANGDRLKIKTIDDLNNFITDNEYKNKKEVMLYKKYNPSSKNTIIAFKLINCDSTNSYNIVDILEEEDYIEFNKLLKNLGLMSSLDINTPDKSKSIIQKISNDESISDRIVNFIKEKAYELLNRFNDRVDKEKEELLIYLNPLLEEFKTKWFYKEEHTKEILFGYFITSINSISNSDIDDSNSKLLSKKIFVEFSNYIHYNNGIIDDYINWINPNAQELEIINNIINSIHKY